MYVKEFTQNVHLVSGKIEEVTQYIIYPDKYKKLRNKITGYIVKTFIAVSSKKELQYYEEIE